MKTRRFLSAFLLLCLIFSLCATPLALADETASKEVPDPAIQAKAALLVDQKTGTVLYQKDIHKQLYPASLTKIMTCLLVLQAVDAGTLKLDQQITAPAAAYSGLDEDGSTANIKEGEILTVEQLLYCLMVVSANESANILAVTVGGSISDFVDMMNAEAEKLGCKDTHFANPIGLQDTQHYTSAWDLYLIAKEALNYDEFMTICDTADIVLPATNLSKERHLYSTNYLLSSFRATGYIDKDAHGIKTGSTSDAGHCLVSTASRGGLSFISVVLGAEKVTLPSGKTQVQSFSETSRLFDWGFDNFTYQTVLSPNDMLGSMEVTLSKDVDYVSLHPEAEVTVLMPKVLKPEDLGEIPANVTTMAFTPQLEVLEHCDYFITHAGTGSAMEALYYGVPCLCIPQMDEQMLTADRMVELKLASAALRKPQVTEETLKKALTELIDNPVYTKNAKRVSKEMNEEGGCGRAAQAVIDFMTGRK